MVEAAALAERSSRTNWRAGARLFWRCGDERDDDGGGGGDGRNGSMMRRKRRRRAVPVWA